MAVTPLTDAQLAALATLARTAAAWPDQTSEIAWLVTPKEAQWIKAAVEELLQWRAAQREAETIIGGDEEVRGLAFGDMSIFDE